MRIRESVYCPHCRYPLKVMARTPNTYSEGCPLKKCPRCQNTYLDMRCKEPALAPYRKINFFKNIFYGLAFGMGSSLFAFFAIAILAPEEYITVLLLSYFLIATIAIFGLICWGENKNSAYFQKLWKESDARLRNVEYAKMLANAGFQVPKHYLPDGFVPNPSILNILKM